MTASRYCDGLRRRDFLRIGALGGSMGWLGLSLPEYLRSAAAGDVKTDAPRSAVYINLVGGPSHVDSFDMKPDAPSEIRGEFESIETSMPGLRLCQHLPNLARCADKYALLRGVSHSLAAHDLGRRYLATGNRPLPSLEFPSYGSVVAKELQHDRDLPRYVAIPKAEDRAGFLGVRYAPLETAATPKPGEPFQVRGIALREGITVSDVERRYHLLGDLDRRFAQLGDDDALVDGLDEFSRQALAIISSPRARTAFDTSQEPREVAEVFGTHDFGQSCLLAYRLVASGVRFVTITFGGWDTHQDNFTRLGELLPQLDEGLAALITTLDRQGLLATTSVFTTGEFGRTPKINERGGRDHWPRSMFCLLAGGGMKGGRVIGASDAEAMGPAGDAITPDMVAASFYRSLGIDFTKEYQTSTGRPVMIVREGSVIEELFA